MRFRSIFAFAFILPTSAYAGCAPNVTTLLSCSAGKGTKVLDLCSDGANVLYRFGTAGLAPDLELIRSVRQVGYTPWPGVGSAILESVAVTNGGYTYEVYSSIARNPEDPKVSGGVEVFQDGKSLASVQCDAGSVYTNIDALFEMREAAGLCYDYASFSWKNCN
jgi:hypothetical protein